MKYGWISILSALLLALVAIVPGRFDRVSAQAEPAMTVFQLVNEIRAEHGLPPFRYNPALGLAAQNQAGYNAAHGLYEHTGESGSRPLDRARASGYQGAVVENVVGGTDLTPRQGVTWWVNSPVHYNTLITTRYEEAGTGYAANGRQNHYTLVVGRPVEDASANTPDPRQPTGPPAFVAPIILSEPNDDGSITHEVKTGQTLWAIAARYQVRLDELRLFNNLSHDSFIHPGDTLTIRLADGQLPPPTPTPPFTHVVRQGETLWTIAASYRLKLADLLWLNALDEDALLIPGDELTIRLAEGQAPPPTPTPKSIHIVQAGETAWEIAAQYDLTLDELMALNDLAGANLIHPGDRLNLRASLTPEFLPNEELPDPSATPTAISIDPTTRPSNVGPVAMAPTLTPLQPEDEMMESAPSTAIPLRAEEQPVAGRGIASAALVVAAGLTLLAAFFAAAAYRTR